MCAFLAVLLLLVPLPEFGHSSIALCPPKEETSLRCKACEPSCGRSPAAEHCASPGQQCPVPECQCKGDFVRHPPTDSCISVNDCKKRLLAELMRHNN